MEIDGAVARAVLRLPRSVLLEGHRVALLDDADELHVRPVLFVSAVGDDVLVRGCIPPGHRIVVDPAPALGDGTLAAAE